MRKFLKKHKLSKLTQEEINNLKSPLPIIVVKNLPSRKTPDPYGFTGEF